jgi:hypothetical protein
LPGKILWRLLRECFGTCRDDSTPEFGSKLILCCMLLFCITGFNVSGDLRSLFLMDSVWRSILANWPVAGCLGNWSWFILSCYISNWGGSGELSWLQLFGMGLLFTGTAVQCHHSSPGFVYNEKDVLCVPITPSAQAVAFSSPYITRTMSLRKEKCIGLTILVHTGRFKTRMVVVDVNRFRRNFLIYTTYTYLFLHVLSIHFHVQAAHDFWFSRGIRLAAACLSQKKSEMLDLQSLSITTINSLM